jgi:restriction system protein
MANLWMVRAGEGGRVADEFRLQNVVALDFEGVDLTHATTREQIRPLVERAYRDRKKGFLPIALAAWHKFRSVISRGDAVMTYDPARRIYSIGKVMGDYEFHPGLVKDYEQIRRVQWTHELRRDDLTPSARNTLGSTLAIFEPGDDVRKELETKLTTAHSLTSGSGPTIESKPFSDIKEPEPATSEIDQIRRDVIDRAHEFIKDRIAKLDWEELQELMAAILRAMGFKSRVSPIGPDRGKDIIASPDGLGLSSPRIKVEVKHRAQTQMGAPEIRSFLGGLRGEDRGLYVSTGGFTREAHYEAERAALPIHLIDLDLLATLLVQNYEQMDNEGKAIVPLIRFYWPAGLD